METSWASEDFVFCVTYDTVGEEYRISKAAADNMYVTIEYLTEDAVPAFVIEELSIAEPISVPDIMNPDENEVCPTLDLNEYESAIITDIKANSSTRRLLAPEEDTSSKRKWYQKSGVLAKHPALGGRRELSFSSYDFTLYVSRSEYNKFLNFAYDVLTCVYFCAPAEYGHMEISLDSLSNYVSFGASPFRKLAEEQHITLPRPCVMVHGAGYQDLVEMAKNKKDKGNSAGLYTTADLDYFGYIDESQPCYCSSMRFVELDTDRMEWYNIELQIATCRTIAMVTLGSKNVGTSTSKAVAIKNTVVFTHFTSTLTLGAAIADGYCTFHSSSKWASIHTPVGGIEFDDKDADGQALLCNRSNMNKLVANFKKYKSGYNEVASNTKKRLAYWDNLSSMLKVKVAGGYNLEDVYEACSHQDEDPKWINELNPLDFPFNVESMYKKAMDKVVMHLSAALCGRGRRGLMSSKRFLNSYTQRLAGINSNGDSDGITPLLSCLALADMKNGVKFSTNPADPYYRTSSYNTDVNRFRDGWSGSRSQMKTWVDNLRMHEDL